MSKLDGQLNAAKRAKFEDDDSEEYASDDSEEDTFIERRASPTQAAPAPAPAAAAAVPTAAAVAAPDPSSEATATVAAGLSEKGTAHDHSKQRGATLNDDIDEDDDDDEDELEGKRVDNELVDPDADLAAAVREARKQTKGKRLALPADDDDDGVQDISSMLREHRGSEDEDADMDDEEFYDE